MASRFGTNTEAAIAAGAERYITIPWAFVRATRSVKMGLEEKEVLLALLDEVRGSSRVCVAQSQLAEKTGIERHNVQRAITRLKVRGFIKLVEREYQRQSQIYDLSPVALLMDGFVLKGEQQFVSEYEEFRAWQQARIQEVA